MAKAEPLEVMGVEEFLKMTFDEEDVLEGRLLQWGGGRRMAGATGVGRVLLFSRLGWHLCLGGGCAAWGPGRREGEGS